MIDITDKVKINVVLERSFEGLFVGSYRINVTLTENGQCVTIATLRSKGWYVRRGYTIGHIPHPKWPADDSWFRVYKESGESKGGSLGRVYTLWTEGYVATGESGTATLLGTAKGRTLREAAKNYAEAHPEDASYFNMSFTHYWSCRIFDNEADARKSFG